MHTERVIISNNNTLLKNINAVGVALDECRTLNAGPARLLTIFLFPLQNYNTRDSIPLFNGLSRTIGISLKFRVEIRYRNWNRVSAALIYAAFNALYRVDCSDFQCFIFVLSIIIWYKIYFLVSALSRAVNVSYVSRYHADESRESQRIVCNSNLTRSRGTKLTGITLSFIVCFDNVARPIE